MTCVYIYSLLDFTGVSRENKFSPPSLSLSLVGQRERESNFRSQLLNLLHRDF